MKKSAKLILLLLIALGLGAALFFYYGLSRGWYTLPTQPHTATSPPASPAFTHVVIILEENKARSAIIGNAEAPYLNRLAKEYAVATNYFALTHPSLPNYIALTSGTTAGITNNCNPPSNACMANVASIADRLEQAGKTWKAYDENMQVPCQASNVGAYAVKHNPFLYYPAVTSDLSRCAAHVVPFSQFDLDLRSADSLPNYAFITPNLCHDMHSCSVRTGDDWLAEHVPPILNSPAFTQQASLLVITWDEGSRSNNNVPTIFAGSAAKASYASSRHCTHYSLLRTIENNWNLPPLTENDKTAPLMTDLLK